MRRGGVRRCVFWFIMGGKNQVPDPLFKTRDFITTELGRTKVFGLSWGGVLQEGWREWRDPRLTPLTPPSITTHRAPAVRNFPTVRKLICTTELN